MQGKRFFLNSLVHTDCASSAACVTKKSKPPASGQHRQTKKPGPWGCLGCLRRRPIHTHNPLQSVHMLHEFALQTLSTNIAGLCEVTGPTVSGINSDLSLMEYGMSATGLPINQRHKLLDTLITATPPRLGLRWLKLNIFLRRRHATQLLLAPCGTRRASCATGPARRAAAVSTALG